MNFFWTKTPSFIRIWFSNYVWKMPNNEKKIYLTFDDGPIPEVTEWALSILKEEKIKATFFCIGDNIKKHTLLFERIQKEGHAIGNHTFNHLNGWKTNTNEYIENFKLGNEIIQKYQLEHLEEKTESTKLFRPPYGKIKSSQAKIIIKLNHKIIMWDVLSYDFNAKITPEKCLENVIKNTTTGSIIVFHDSLKAYKNLEYALPKAIQLLKQKGFEFDIIT